MNIMIIESPNKIKIIEKFLKDYNEKEWRLFSTQGYIKNINPKTYGLIYHKDRIEVDIVWEKGKEKIINKIINECKKAEEVYIATDLDREGESIAYYLYEILSTKLSCDIYRIGFREITKKAIFDAIKNKGNLNKGAIKAQRARRIIDREVSYPVIDIMKYDFFNEFKKEIPKSIGRTLAPALNLIALNQKEIDMFFPEEYQEIKTIYNVQEKYFELNSIEKYVIEDERTIKEDIEKTKNNRHIVDKIEEKKIIYHPHKPLNTSKMQRLAWYMLGYRPEKTMKYAQKLYENGLITYPRTDSIDINEEAVESISIVLNKYFNQFSDLENDEYILEVKREYKKSNSNNAHEAIRPVEFNEKFFPKNIARDYSFLGELCIKLYELIWYTTITTQMKDSVYIRKEIEVACGDLKYKGKSIYREFEGWEKLYFKYLAKDYIQNKDETYKRENINPLPEDLEVGDEIYLYDIKKSSYKTKTPSRYGIGRFVDTLFNLGIARPSTIGTIVSRLEKYGYIRIINGMIYILDLGMETNEWITDNAPWLNDLEEAKIFETKLDLIEKEEIEDEDELIRYYHLLVEKLKKHIGYFNE